jgi:hypothetical protein
MRADHSSALSTGSHSAMMSYACEAACTQINTGVTMNQLKRSLLALSMLASLGFMAPAMADGGASENDVTSSYFQRMRPMIMKMADADKKKAMAMEAAIMKMEGDHAMAMTKASMEHKLAIMKMKREYEEFLYSKGAF